MNTCTLIFLSVGRAYSLQQDGYQILKYHGSYMQDNRELRKKGQQKVVNGLFLPFPSLFPILSPPPPSSSRARTQAYSFMLRLKMPCGDVPPALQLKLDELCDRYGQHNLRATTRQAYQMHGVMKGDLKEASRGKNCSFLKCPGRWGRAQCSLYT